MSLELLNRVQRELTLTGSAVHEAVLAIAAPIQGDEVRVTAPSRDELQAVIAFLRGQDFGIELKFGNYRG